MPTPPALDTLMQDVKARLESSGCFGAIELKNGMLIAAAKASAEPAFYRLEPEAGGALWISLVTPSRWLSESIESDLVEHGDDLGELIEDELIELGYEGAGMPPTFQHYRSPDLLYTFRTPVPASLPAGGGIGSVGPVAEVVAVWMRAYEQAFRRLGDMEDRGEE